ncbi:MAG: ABC-F family ATP-binding cassette domain-containing protein [Clostridia bacterium]|nr:ABC-F family ATP-binding cassette domain-containing protein [Clostridia bacterium]
MASVIDIKNLSCEFGAVKVLEDVNMTVFTGDRVGVIGDNGSGKTTLLNIVAGRTDDFVYRGQVIVNAGGRIGMLSQRTGEDDRNVSVYDDYISVFAELIRLENEIAELEKSLAEGVEDAEALSGRISKDYELFVAKGGLTYKSRVQGMLAGLGFEGISHLPVKSLSGGQKIRLALGKLLLEAPELLLLDEPTNHLDTESIVFLEESLKNYKGTVLAVSHDRYFLDTVTSKTFLIEAGVGTLYNAPYTKYIPLREQDIEYKKRLYARQQKEIAHINDVISTQRRWGQEHNFVTAEAWQKKLDRMDILDDPSVNANEIAVKFEIAERGGDEVLSVKDLSFGYDAPLFEGLSFDVRRGDRLVITGRNGGGKSTLLKLINGLLTPTGGTIKIGAGITISYYSQDFAELDLSSTPFEETFLAANYDYYNGGGLPKFRGITSCRNALASFGFTGDDVFKSNDLLSGGEKARLALLKLTYKKGNLLLLDEPTNHLDIRTCEVLENAIINFPGTVICVSHDRYFVEKIGAKKLDLDGCSLFGRRISSFATGLDSYAPGGQQGIRKSRSAEAKESYLKVKEDRAAERKLKKRISTLEDSIASLEKELAECEAILSDPSLASDFELIASTYSRQSGLKEQLDALEFDYLEAIEESERRGEV